MDWQSLSPFLAFGPYWITVPNFVSEHMNMWERETLFPFPFPFPCVGSKYALNLLITIELLDPLSACLTSIEHKFDALSTINLSIQFEVKRKHFDSLWFKLGRFQSSFSRAYVRNWHPCSDWIKQWEINISHSNPCWQSICNSDQKW